MRIFPFICVHNLHVFFSRFIAQLFPEAKCLVEACKLNREGWTVADTLFSSQWERGGHELLSDPKLEEQVMAKMEHHCGLPNCK
jgi:hypothetical protein